MPEIALIDDNFTGLALNTTISARIPPVNNGTSFVVDPNAAAAVGGGSNDVKFTAGGTAVKIRGDINGAIRIVMDDKGGNESFSIYTRDSASTPYPRYGYAANFNTRSAGGTNGVYSLYTINNYNGTAIGAENRPWTFASNGINTVAFESINNDHRIIINNVLATSFTNSTWPAIANQNKYSVVFHSTAPSVMRMDRFTIVDSVVITVSAAYPIVMVA